MRRIAILSVFLFVVAACGDSGGNPLQSSSTSTTATPPSTVATTTTSVATTTTAPPVTTSSTDPGPQAASSLEAAHAAVVQIVAEGSFVDPVAGVQANVPGSGSGFIIDPSGLAVTNNHVVTGAALLRVFVPGSDAPRNARVVAVSECSDLAVIDLEGDGYPFLAWHEGEPVPGLSVFAAGYPLGDSEYTLLDGIIAKARADGETSWASIDNVVEHTADALPGNSGGPLLDSNGAVVGVVYAGNALGQAFAIGNAEVHEVLDRLVGGTDVDSIGINGEAIVVADQPGIWVASVASGSPADTAGVLAGDLLVSLEGLELATDGTMRDYCDVLRSHRPTDTMSITVVRESTGEILEGQLNGRVLEATFSLAADVEDTGATGDASSDAPPYDVYETITDDSGLISVSIPSEWDDRYGASWSRDGNLVGPALSAASDRDLWINSWELPGLFIAASDELGLTPTELLDEQVFSNSCTYDDRYEYDDGTHQGFYDLWTECGGTTTFVVIAAEPLDAAFLINLQITLVDERDFAALDEIITTFVVSGVDG